MLKRNSAIIALAAINLICAILHAVFQLDLLSEAGQYRGFLLTENMVVTFIFAYSAIILLFGKPVLQRAVLSMSVFFWAFFLIVVACIQPSLTTLTLIKGALFAPQSILLFVTGSIALILSLLGRRCLAPPNGSAELF